LKEIQTRFEMPLAIVIAGFWPNSDDLGLRVLRPVF